MDHNVSIDVSIDDALALSSEAGWNQTARDWRRVLSLSGEGVFHAAAGGRTIATATALIYSSELAWIGMVLTAAAHRGQGHAGRLMQAALDYLDARGVRVTKLDATGLGRPVYARMGFVDERPVSRWVRQPAPWTAAVQLESAPVDFDLDREAFGVDRRQLLEALAAEEEVDSLGARGFAIARPGRIGWQLGPLVARDAEAAATLLSAQLTRHGGEVCCFDLTDDHADAVRLAAEAGFTPVRRLVRMSRGDAAGTALASGPWIYGCAGFELG